MGKGTTLVAALVAGLLGGLPECAVVASAGQQKRRVGGRPIGVARNRLRSLLSHGPDEVFLVAIGTSFQITYGRFHSEAASNEEGAIASYRDYRSFVARSASS